MATKADRGTKRVCQNCRSKFYDLNRSPIICPICHAVFELRTDAPKPAFAASSKAAVVPDDVVVAGDGIELVPLDEVEAVENGEIADIDADDLVEIDDSDTDLGSDDDEETFLEDDDADPDVTGFVGGPIESDEDA